MVPRFKTSQLDCTCEKYRVYLLGETNQPVCEHILAVKLSRNYCQEKVVEQEYSNCLDYINEKKAKMIL